MRFTSQLRGEIGCQLLKAAMTAAIHDLTPPDHNTGDYCMSPTLFEPDHLERPYWSCKREGNVT